MQLTSTATEVPRDVIDDATAADRVLAASPSELVYTHRLPAMARHYAAGREHSASRSTQQYTAHMLVVEQLTGTLPTPRS
jgi:hypothetical protein